MKLKTFNSETLPKQNGGGSKMPRISFNKAGAISFNQAACKLMGATEKDKLTLAQDTEDTDNWYVFIDNENGFPVRLGYDKKGCLMNHKKLVDAVVAGFELKEGITHSFKIAGQPTTVKGDKTKYWGLIAPVKL